MRLNIRAAFVPEEELPRIAGEVALNRINRIVDESEPDFGRQRLAVGVARRTVSVPSSRGWYCSRSGFTETSTTFRTGGTTICF